MQARVQELFELLCDLSPEKREHRLKSLSEADSAFRDAVRSLLKSHDGAGRFLSEATTDCYASGPETASIAERPGDTIGRYKLLEKIGEGGFGMVYMAQQVEPVRRRVALKIIKLGMDTGQTVARFEAERQALAMMDHPHIARVLDGGATESGRPYFVMELVRGEPITGYCDRCRMPLRDRLALFQQVCLAVEHAHQKGIVHRDIKPTNVLVTVADGRPLVKVIDFGIAKALNAELTEKTLYTEFRQLIGTPQYMSPEQAERSGVDVDTRSDIYSLGVLLYETLTGATPVDPERLRSAAWGEWQKMIAEEEASRPSMHVAASLQTLGDVARYRSIDPEELSAVLRGDLDWIVLKALEKDRSRRYATASQLADDVARYLDDRPVLATPPSKRYLMQKLLRRHRRAVVFASLLLASILLGLVGTAMTAAWALRERADAIVARNAADERAAQVRRMAALAGSPLLTKKAADQLSAQWASDIEDMRRDLDLHEPDLVRLECQYATWLAGHALRYGDDDASKDAMRRAAELVPRAKQALEPDDVNLLSLLNAAIQAHATSGSPPGEIVALYDDLIPMMFLIHGDDTTRQILPEYTVRLAQANRREDVERVIDQYLDAAEGKDLSDSEVGRLNHAVHELSQSSMSNTDAYARLLAFRDSGLVASPSGSAVASADDRDLADDLQAMQGTWRTTSRGATLELTIDGSQGDVAFLDERGNVVRRDNARFVLSRSGAAKLLTRYRIGQDPSQGDAVIYMIAGDTMVYAEGLITGVQNRSAPGMVVWERKQPAK